jgi:hypothetical protein
MAPERSEGATISGYNWLAAAGLGVAAAWYLWLRGRPTGRLGAHAWLVPLSDARQEAEWTRHALRHSVEAKQE